MISAMKPDAFEHTDNLVQLLPVVQDDVRELRIGRLLDDTLRLEKCQSCQKPRNSQTACISAIC